MLRVNVSGQTGRRHDKTLIVTKLRYDATTTDGIVLTVAMVERETSTPCEDFCDFAIADIVPFTCVKGLDHERVKVSNYPNVAAWLDRVASRPSVKKAMVQKFG
jgi:glutathione S-transferase